MNKQELIDDIKKITYSDLECNSPERMLSQQKLMILDKVRQLDEPSKVKIPPFVAEYLELTKKEEFSFDAVFVHVNKMPERVWLWKRDNHETFLRAWLDGYEVEEPLYQIELPGTSWGAYLTKADNGDIVIFQNTTSGSAFTESEIKAIDERYWAFAVQVEEVK